MEDHETECLEKLTLNGSNSCNVFVVWKHSIAKNRTNGRLFKGREFMCDFSFYSSSPWKWLSLVNSLLIERKGPLIEIKRISSFHYWKVYLFN